MDTHDFVVALALGAALLALWCHVRWPKLAPASFRAGVVRVIAGFLALQLGLVVLDAAADTSIALAFLAIVAVVVPVLTFAFLTSLWILKLFAESIKGYR